MTPRGGMLAAAGLLLSSLIWGTSWWPFRLLQQRGLHPLWATAFVYGLAVLALIAWRPRGLIDVAKTPTLWVLLLASGCTNAAFNWAVSIGDVVRVVLLFYLMPLWTALFARCLLGERLSARAAVRIALALAGALVVLWPEVRGLSALPIPRSLPDWLGVVGGMSFALNNVMLRHEAHRDEGSRAIAMFVGGVTVSALLALTLPGVPLPPAPHLDWLAIACVLAVLFMASNLGLQYGAARLPANVSSVVMISEVLFATGSAAWWGDAQMTWAVTVGGALIVGAALLAAWSD